MATMENLPSSLLEWPPWIWANRLFTGKASDFSKEPVSPWAWMIVLFLPALLVYPCLNFALMEPDESRYAEIPREMLLRGDFITPVLSGEAYLDKPPLLYWFIAGSYSLFGVADWSARLVPAISLHLTVLVIFFLGRKIFGQKAALAGSIILCLSPGFISMGRLLLIDSLLTLWVTLSLLAGYEALFREKFHRGWWIVTAVSCGLGILTKGPVALVLLLPPLMLQRWLTGQSSRISWPNLFLFAFILLAINLPWYLALSLRITNFLWVFIYEHHLLRYLSSYAHAQGIWYYGPVLLLGIFPGSILLWPLFQTIISGKTNADEQRPSALGYCLLASGWCLFFFTLSTCKLPTYIMPAMPILCLALGWLIIKTPAINESRLPRLAFLIMVPLLVFANHLGLPWYANYRNPIDQAGELLHLCSDPLIPVVCYPRDCNSVSFYLDRPDIKTFRSKNIEDLRDLVRKHPRVVVLCTHRNSYEGLVQLLPPEVHVTSRVSRRLADIPGVPKRWMKTIRDLLGRSSLGLGDVAVVERWDKTLPPGGMELAEAPPERSKARGPGAGSHKN